MTNYDHHHNHHQHNHHQNGPGISASGTVQHDTDTDRPPRGAPVPVDFTDFLKRAVHQLDSPTLSEISRKRSFSQTGDEPQPVREAPGQRNLSNGENIDPSLSAAMVTEESSPTQRAVAPTAAMTAATDASPSVETKRLALARERENLMAMLLAKEKEIAALGES